MRSFSLILFFYSCLIWSQSPYYKINAVLDFEQKTVSVRQTFHYENSSTKSLDTLYFNDSNIGYRDAKTPLAKRLAEEFDLSFYLSSKAKNGNTLNLNISEKKENLLWFRLKKQIDIIAVPLKEKLKPNESINLSFTYQIVIPDSKFTGYGINNNKSIYLKNPFLTLSPLVEGKWILNSFLNLEQTPHLSSNFEVDWEFPSDLNFNSNLSIDTKANKKSNSQITLKGNEYKETKFYFNRKKSNFKFFKIDDYYIQSNISTQFSIQKEKQNLQKVLSFLFQQMGDYKHSKILISNFDYSKNPFYPFTFSYEKLNYFDENLYYEIKTLNAFLDSYLIDKLPFLKNNQYWLFSGLKTYLLYNYLDFYYPENKITGKIKDIPFLKFFLNHYSIVNLNLKDGFSQLYEYTLRKNLQQVASSPRLELTKFNEKIALPGYTGIGLVYLKQFNPKEFEKLIAKLGNQKETIPDLENFFYQSLGYDANWFFSTYINTRQSIDLKFRSIELKQDSIKVSVKEKRNKQIPYSVGLVKNDSLIEVKYIKNPKKNQEVTFKNDHPDFLVINPELKIPEFNPRNNWVRVGTKIKTKKLKLTFQKDIENPKRNQLFYKPVIDFNIYDGVAFGFRLGNKSVKIRPFTIGIQPLYSAREKTAIGSVGFSYIFYNEEKNNYFTRFSFSSNSYHYDFSKRYVNLRPSLTFFWRQPNLRSNYFKALSFSVNSVQREENQEQLARPDYTIGSIKYNVSNKNAINHFTFKIENQLSKPFGKLNFVTEFRYLLPSGRRLSARLFLGKFLWKNQLQSTFFDYNLNRPTDYMFEYDYLGRSETSGIFSQQFIVAEGAFKSKFDVTSANNYMATMNYGIGIWKWIELYADVGVLKNDGFSSKFYYDSGIRLNLLSDFIELYFPIYDSTGFQLQQKNYGSKIRFLISDPKGFLNIFTRKWF